MQSANMESQKSVSSEQSFSYRIHQNEFKCHLKQNEISFEAELIASFKVLKGSYSNDRLPTQVKFVLQNIERLYKYLQQDTEARVEISETGLQIIVNVIGEERKIHLSLEVEEMNEEKLKKVIERLNTQNKQLKEENSTISDSRGEGQVNNGHWNTDSRQESVRDEQVRRSDYESGRLNHKFRPSKTKGIKKQYEKQSMSRCDKKCKNCTNKVQYDCYEYCVDCYLKLNRWY